MVTHQFVCDVDEIVIEDTSAKGVHLCPKCGAEMRWDLVGVGIPAGDYEHISDSLAIHPDLTAEHRAKFPNVDVLSDGRLRFTSVREQERYCHATGFDKKEQRKHNLGRKRIV